MGAGVAPAAVFQLHFLDDRVNRALSRMHVTYSNSIIGVRPARTIRSLFSRLKGDS